MSWTIRNKVRLLAGIGLVLVGILGAVLWQSTASASATVAALGRANAAIRNQVEADMMHEAVLGDVLSAMLAEGEGERAAATASAQEHIAEFFARVQANVDLDLPPALRATAEELLPLVREYDRAAAQTIQDAHSGLATARASLPEVRAAFAELEDAMERASDQIQDFAQSEQAAADAALADDDRTGILVVAVALVAMLSGGWLLSRNVARSLDQLQGHVAQLHSGDCDLSRRLDASSRDELGRIAAGVNSFLERIQELVLHIHRDTTALLDEARSLSSTSSALAAGSEQTKAQSAQVAAAAEQMSASFEEIRGASDITADHIRNVVASIEAIGGNIAQVSTSAEDARQISGTAMQLTTSSDVLIRELGAAADEIGRVIGTIQDIADQTNLLALNATIEAARAGEAGKGFSVVANEVKDLARQTSEATTDIRERIERIQQGTQQTVARMGEISGVIEQVSTASQDIAKQVSEQRSSVDTITTDVTDAAQRVEHLRSAVSESTQAATDITQSIAEVDSAARTSSEGAEVTRRAGVEIERLAVSLQQHLSQFGG
ncbi:MAG TPA: methyl-accepting chemotaxis protein [bacterium]|nr:methyl-accepting chemotaxis protein [bacterium]